MSFPRGRASPHHPQRHRHAPAPDAARTTVGVLEVVAMRASDAVGRYGEKVAAGFLREAGMEVLATNWRCPAGEIDLVALDGDCLVVCEVKTRRSALYGPPQDAVTWAKLARLRRLTGLWLDGQDRRFGDVRIDVVAIIVPRSGAAVVEHLRGVA